MAKRQLSDDLAIQPEMAEAEQAPESVSTLVQVRALVPMWGGKYQDQVIVVGTVYELPAAVAADLAGRGMVAIEEAGLWL